MLELTQQLDATAQTEDGVLCLPYEVRQKSRFRARLEDGTEVGVIIDRGGVLRDGDVLSGPAGRRVQVRAAPEAVTTVIADNAADLVRAAYHLGNRHVALQLGDGWLRYLRDHVLDQMCAGLGLAVRHEDAGFEPESGAYGGHRHQHD